MLLLLLLPLLLHPFMMVVVMGHVLIVEQRCGRRKQAPVCRGCVHPVRMVGQGPETDINIGKKCTEPLLPIFRRL